MIQLLLSHPQEATVPVPPTKQPKHTSNLRDMSYPVEQVDIQIIEFKTRPLTTQQSPMIVKSQLVLFKKRCQMRNMMLWSKKMKRLPCSKRTS